MIHFLKRVFIENWPRKIIASILATVIWIVVNHSMVITKTFYNVSVKVINIPEGKTIKGLQADNLLKQKINLTLTANKAILENLSEYDIQAVVNAEKKEGEWKVNLNVDNIVLINNEINTLKYITDVSNSPFSINLVKLVTDKIPILILQPYGEIPQEIQFVDIWPYELFITVSGPENVINTLKTQKTKIRFNLNNITQAEWNQMISENRENKDEITYLVPASWKKISIPSLSSNNFEIDDPRAKFLKIDFIQKRLLPLKTNLPISVFYSFQYIDSLNPHRYTLETNEFVKEKNGLFYSSGNFFVSGISEAFWNMVNNMVEIVIVTQPKEKKEYLTWYVQCINSKELEDHYITQKLSEADDLDIKSSVYEDYLRNRFRNYMNSLRIYSPTNKKLILKIYLKDNKIIVTPQEAI